MAQPVAALIVRVAADLAELKTGVAEINTTLGGVGTAAQKVAGVIGAAFTASQVTAMGRELVEVTSRIDDLAKRYRISAEAVQELDFAAKQNGSTFEAIGNAMAFMSKELVGGDKSTVAALQQLGLSIASLRAMAPDQAFQAIAAAISAVPDPLLQSALNTQLFGRGANQLLPVITSNLGLLREQAKSLGLVITNDLVASGDQLGDTWEQLQLTINNLKAEALLPLMGVFLELPKPMQVTIALATELIPSLTGIGTVILAAGGPVAALGMLSTAFTAIIPFLAPAGAIILGIAAVVLAFKNWDVIKEIVYGVYYVTKTWLVDAFEGIVASIKSRLDTVLSYFTALYERIRAIFLSIVSMGGAAGAMGVEGPAVEGRASGGPVSAGQTYLVGERGPELFTPGASGSIAANGAGSVTIHAPITINGSVLGNKEAVAQAIKDALESVARGSAVRLAVGV